MADLPPFPRELLATVFRGDNRMIGAFEELLSLLQQALDAAASAQVTQASLLLAPFVLAGADSSLGNGYVIEGGGGVSVEAAAGQVRVSHPISVMGGEATFILTGDTNLILPRTGTLATTSSLTGGTVTSVSVVTANGVSGSVANPTTTPAITITLGAITPSSVAASGTVTGSNLSGSNTGDQTITLTGDVTGSGTGSFAATLATVNSNVGSFGGAGKTITATVNGKGLITAFAETPIAITSAQVSGLGTAAAQNTGTSGANVPLLNGANTWSGQNIFSTSVIASGTGSSAAIYDRTTGASNSFLMYVTSGVLRWFEQAALADRMTLSSTGLDVNGESRCNTLRIDVAPTAATPAPTHTFPVNLNGTVYRVPCVI